MKKVLFALCGFLVVSSMAMAGEARLVTPGSTWLFLDDGSDAGTAWRQPTFDDSAWAQGGAQIGYGDQDEVSIARCRVGMNPGQICASGGPADKIVTTYFRRTFHYRSSGAISALRIHALIDDGAIVYLNGEEIARINMPDGEIQFDTLASTATSNEQTYVDLAVSSDALLNGDNFLAVEVHQHSRSSSDISFDLALYGELDGQPGLVRGPYLQSGTPDSAIVLWRTDEPTSSRVEVSSTPGSFSPESFGDATPKTDHAVTVDLSSFGPGKAFYAIGDDSEILVEFDPEQYILVPEEPGVDDTSRIWVIGDSGSADLLAAHVRDGFRRFNGEEQIDAWLMLGDNAYDDGTDEEHQAAVFDMYPMLLRQYMLWPTLGNHDIRNADSPTQVGVYFDIFDLPTQGEIGGVASGTESYYSFDLNNIHFVVLDSADTQLADDGAMAEWLKADLASTLQPWIIAYWHHPPYSKGSHDSDNIRDSGGRMTRMRENILPILEEGGVDLTLTGHSHAYERSFLLHDHHDTSDTLAPEMILDEGGGRPLETGAYFKEKFGAVHAVAGSSSSVSSKGDLDHPAMFISLRLLGSMLIEVEGERLDGTFLSEKGETLDTFTLVKSTLPTLSAPVMREGVEGESVIVTLSLNEPPMVPVQIDFATTSGVAQADVDFVSIAGTATFATGEQSLDLTVELLADDRLEGEENFNILFTNTKNASPESFQTEIQIRDGNTIPGCEDCDRVTCQDRGSLLQAAPEPKTVAFGDLWLPSFAVDTANASGLTTLFALRNPSDETVEVDVNYFETDLALQLSTRVILEPRETESVNLRDVAGLASDANGLSRGAVTFEGNGPIGGDYFRVDVGNSFASGGRLVPDLCMQSEIRYLDFGSGTDLDLFLLSPQGGLPATDPVSFFVDVRGESGNLIESLQCFTSHGVLELDVGLFTNTSFGSLIFDLSPSGGGYVSARYSADGRFSVGVDNVCQDSPARDLVLPSFEVDTQDASGTTTLFAVRNVSDDSIALQADYNAVGGTQQRQDTIMLDPNATHSVNLRDVPGLEVDGDGFARGYVELSASGSDVPGDAVLVGDFFQVDVGNNFATGERLISPAEFCQRGEIRFLDFGAGTRLRVLVGDAPGSFTVIARDEAGSLLANQIRPITEDLITLEASQITAASFGTLEFDFADSSGGFVYAEYSAEGQFSVGVEMTCLD